MSRKRASCLSYKNAGCHAENATLSSADVSHARLCIREHSLFPTEHYKFPETQTYLQFIKLSTDLCRSKRT